MKLSPLIEKNAKIVPLSAGATLFEASDPGDYMYIVKEGEADIVVQGEVVETVGPDGFFGEMALLTSEVRSAKVVAKTDCILLGIDQKQFVFMVQQVPFFAIEVMRVMADRLRRQGNRR